MTPRRIRITGPEGSLYRLGDPINVYDADTCLGRLDPVPVSVDGSEVHLEHFHPTEVVRGAQIHVGRLIFLEICEFLSEHFHQVQAVSFAFTRRVDILGGGLEQASARAETMTRIGAVNVQVAPNALHGHFVVSGVWLYNTRNLESLRVVLAEERLRYEEWAAQSQAMAGSGLLGALQRLLSR